MTWRYPYLFASLCAVTLLSFAIEAFTHGPWTIPDDARQFLSWTPRLLDPSLLQGDLIADYWHDMSPPFYRAAFEVAAIVGVEPRLFSLLLTFVLLPAMAFAVWRLASAISDRPSVAFAAAAVGMAGLLQIDHVFSGTPRAFAAPATIFFLDGLLRRKRWQMLLSLAVIAFFYPAVSASALGMLGLALVRWRPRLTIERSMLLNFIAGAAIVAAAASLFGESALRWGDTLRLSDIDQYPALVHADGRNSIVGAGSSDAYFCGSRMAFLPKIVGCSDKFGPVLPIVNLIIFLPFLWVALSALRPDNEDRAARLCLLALGSAIICYAIAFAVAFQLHLPGRYSQPILAPLVTIIFGRTVGRFLIARWPAAIRRYGAAAALLVLAILYSVPETALKAPADDALVARVAALPRDAVVAGAAPDLDFLPALTGRKVLETSEHTIPYKLGYYDPMRERLYATAAALRSTDEADLMAFLDRYDVTHIVVERALLDEGTLPERFWTLIPDTPLSTQKRPALANYSDDCVLHASRDKGQGTVLLIDARCVSTNARRTR